MWRNILGIFVGVLVGGLVVGLIESAGLLFHPLPSGVDLTDHDALKIHAAKAPPAAMIPVAIAWFTGPLVGSWLTTLLARQSLPSVVVCFVFLAADIYSLTSFPHPLWLVIAGLLAPLTGVWLGVELANAVSRQAIKPRPYDMRRKHMAC